MKTLQSSETYGFGATDKDLQIQVLLWPHRGRRGWIPLTEWFEVLQRKMKRNYFHHQKLEKKLFLDNFLRS